ncbi:hypothetical protein [Gloeobacter morelensis]|uniref:Uncharacterized protein n=1 Tax=Gloeobacter morelensis MG652769 TaxID=2781736 RepID=A0ABY3PSG4_9CYAN|nr:hypothetical protein [Gloeobacter morelensis]UFP96630.1 hypothetical protein ISF26_10650 [Gloeobacter morelensis MG652769]
MLARIRPTPAVKIATTAEEREAIFRFRRFVAAYRFRNSTMAARPSPAVARA